MPVHFIVIAAVLFAIGSAGAIIRRNALVLLMSIELMLNASNLVFVAYAEQFRESLRRLRFQDRR